MPEFRNRIIISLWLALLVQGPWLLGQVYQVNNNIPVYGLDGRQWQHPWTGGVNHPKYNAIDLNHNGKLDLIVSDTRQNGGITFKPFVNLGSCNEIKYEYAPQYESWFEGCECRAWVMFRDYNHDGLPDIFCGAKSGQNYKVYQATRYPNDSIGFALTYPLLTYVDEVFTPPQEFLTYVVRTDLPGIADLDFDGDLDILSSSNGSLSYTWYRNLGVENYNNPDTLVFTLETACWGRFGISTRALFIPPKDLTCFRDSRGGSTTFRHEGSSLFPIDFNGDQLMDVLAADVDHNKATMAINGGDQTLALMETAIENYPQTDSAIDLIIFPAFYYLDVNNDSIKDLLISSQPPGTIDIRPENVYGTILYLNEGKDDSLALRFQDRTFFVRDHIDAGSFSHPVFLDYNEDGRMDLLVGSGGSYERFGAETRNTYNLLLFENTGTLTEPAFKLKDRYFLNLSQSSLPLESVSLAAGDLDNDGDADLLMGNSAGNIYHLENISAIGSPANFVAAVQPILLDDKGNEAGVRFNSSPELADIEGDGDLDLWVGGFDGKITFYENIGSPENPRFQFRTDTFGGIDLDNEFGGNDGFAKPRVVDWNDDNRLELIVGGRAGEVMVYPEVASGLTQELKATETLLPFQYATYSAPAIADLYGNGQPVMVVGDRLGGLVLYNAQPRISTAPDSCKKQVVDISPRPSPGLTWEVFPNPSRGRLSLRSTQSFAQANLRLINSLGQVVAQARIQQPSFTWELPPLSKGIYILRIDADKEIYQEKIILQP